jgi:hypothetical protein
MILENEYFMVIYKFFVYLTNKVYLQSTTTSSSSSNPVHGEVYSIQHYVIKYCQWLATGRLFSPGSPVYKTLIELYVMILLMYKIFIIYIYTYVHCIFDWCIDWKMSVGILIVWRVYLPVMFWWYDECIFLLCFDGMTSVFTCYVLMVWRVYLPVMFYWLVLILLRNKHIYTIYIASCFQVINIFHV